MDAILVRVLYLVVSTVVVVLVQRFLSAAPSAQASVDALVSKPSRQTLSDVGGHAAIKRELWTGVVLPMRNPKVFYASGVRALAPPRGILLHGPPGTGKTLLARATAAECGVPLLTLHAAALESKWWGDTPKLLHAVFTAARERYAPCLVFIDELDGMGRARSDGDQSCVYSFKCELLRNLDSVQDAAVVVLACTNCPDALDPALRRRFARRLHVLPPTRAERAAIAALLLKDEVAGVSADAVAERTAGFTGADLHALVDAACAARLQRATPDALAGAEDERALVRALGPLTLSDVREGATKISRTLDEEAPPPDAETPHPSGASPMRARKRA